MAHTPGRGHRRKSDPPKKRRYQKRAKKAKTEADERYDKAVTAWELLSEVQRRFCPELDPERVRPRWR